MWKTNQFIINKIIANYKPWIKVVSSIIFHITDNDSILMEITIDKKLDFWNTFVSHKQLQLIEQKMNN